MKGKNHAMLAIILAVVMIFTVGCQNSKQESDTKTITIGFTGFSEIEEMCKEYKAGVMQAAADYTTDTLKVDVVCGDSGGDASKQISVLEDFISKQVDVIAFSCVDSDALVGVVDRARDAGIKVIAWGDYINTETDGVCNLDDTAMGEMSGEYIAEAIGGKGTVFVADTPPVVISCCRRSDGAIAALEKNPDIEVISMIAETPIREQEVTVFENVLQAHPEIVGMIGIDGDTTMALLLACEAQGRTEVVVAGPGVTGETIGVLAEDRQLIGMVDLNYYELGYIAGEMSIKSVLGEEFENVLLGREDFTMVTNEIAKERLAAEKDK